jgi:hypothetical protein
MNQLKGGALQRDVGGTLCPVVIYKRRMIVDELFQLVQFLPEPGDFLLQRGQFSFSVHRLGEVFLDANSPPLKGKVENTTTPPEYADIAI